MSKNQDKMTWNDVTLEQFNRLQELVQIEDETERVVAIAEYFLGEDITDLPLAEFKEKVKTLSFLTEPIPEIRLPKKLTINGRKYHMDCLLGNVNTSQYIDYTNHSKTNELNKMMSVFIIPDGHKYNDGYDMVEVMNDINNIPITIVNAAAFFFGKQFATFMKIFQRYSIKEIKKTNLPKAEKERLTEIVENSVDLALYPLFSNSAK